MAPGEICEIGTAREIVPNVNSISAACRATGALNVYLQNTIDVGVGNLVDADLAKESANLQALQTKQQLGIQALSIANQSSSILLGLFK